MFWHSSKLRQYLAAFCSGMCIFCGGAAFVWVTPLLVRLEGPDSEVPLTPGQSSWLVSLIEIGNLLTPIPVGFLVDRIGRKPVLLATGPIYIATWILVLTTRSVEILYLVRIVQGLAMGIQFTVLPMYLGEIAGPEIRGTISIFFQTMWYLGILYVYAIGPYVSYQLLTWLALAPCFVFLGLYWWVPESPYYLLMKRRDKEAKAALTWLRGGGPLTQIDAELEGMRVSVQGEHENKASWRDIVGKPEGRRALFIILMICTCEMMSGVSAVLSYSSHTFNQTPGDFLSPDVFTLIMGLLTTCMSVLTGGLVDRAGRRPILLVSTVGSSICLLATGLYYEFYPSVDLSFIWWLPYSGVTLYLMLISFGAGPLVPTLQAELFSNSTRGLASGVATFTLTVGSFICLKIYQPLALLAGLSYNFFMFSIFCSAGAIGIYFFVPETKGKTFAEIQQILRK